MNSITTADAETATIWLNRFETALRACDREALEAMFQPACYWRDMLAFTWAISPHEGRDNVVGGLLQAQPKVHARNFEIAEGRKSPRRVRRLGTEVTEAIFAFETDAGFHADWHGRAEPSSDRTITRAFLGRKYDLLGQLWLTDQRRPSTLTPDNTFVGAAEVEVDAGKPELRHGMSRPVEMLWVRPKQLNTNRACTEQWRRSKHRGMRPQVGGIAYLG